MMTGSFSFGAKNAYFKLAGGGFSSKVGGSYVEGANLCTTSASFASAPASCEKFCTTASSYPMEKLVEESFAKFTEFINLE